MKNRKLLPILLILLLAKTSSYAQPENFYHEFPIHFSDSVSLAFQQNSFQISDSTYLSSGNYGPNFYGLAGRVIWDSAGNVLDAKYLDVDESFYLNGLARIDSNRFLLYGNFDYYHDNTGNMIDKAAAMVCFNQNGDVLWQKAYGGYASGYPDITEDEYDYYDVFHHVEVDSLHQRIYAMGYSKSFNDEHKAEPYVVCTDYNGDTIWTYAMPDLPEYNGHGYLDGGAVVTSYNDILLTGHINIAETSIEGVNLLRGIIIKLTAEGEMLWHKTWGYNNARCSDVIELYPGRYVAGGIHINSNNVSDISSGHLVVLNDAGSFIEEKEITRGNYTVFKLYKLIKQENGFAAIGSFRIKENWEFINDNFFINKYTNALNVINKMNYIDSNSVDGDFGISGVSRTFDGGYLYTGYAGNQENAVMKSDSELNLPLSEGWNYIDINYTNTRISYYPNPVSNTLSIKSSPEMLIKDLKLYDMYGRIVFQKQANNNTIKLDVNNIESGIYILRINNQYSGKVLIE